MDDSRSGQRQAVTGAIASAAQHDGMLDSLDIFMRLGATAITAGVIGLDRETRGQAVGLRTTVLVSVTAALAMILSESLIASHVSVDWHPDPGRIAVGVLTGIGFLGAGAIMKDGQHIRGLTTAALLWYVTVQGLAFGGGYYLLGAIGWGGAVFTAVFMRIIERHLPRDVRGVVILSTAVDIDEAALRRSLAGLGLTITAVTLCHDRIADVRRLRAECRFTRRDELALARQVVATLGGLPGVREVAWE